MVVVVFVMNQSCAQLQCRLLKCTYLSDGSDGFIYKAFFLEVLLTPLVYKMLRGDNFIIHNNDLRVTYLRETLVSFRKHKTAHVSKTSTTSGRHLKCV